MSGAGHPRDGSGAGGNVVRPETFRPGHTNASDGTAAGAVPSSPPSARRRPHGAAQRSAFQVTSSPLRVGKATPVSGTVLVGSPLRTSASGAGGGGAGSVPRASNVLTTPTRAPSGSNATGLQTTPIDTSARRGRGSGHGQRQYNRERAVSAGSEDHSDAGGSPGGNNGGSRATAPAAGTPWHGQAGTGGRRAMPTPNTGGSGVAWAANTPGAYPDPTPHRPPRSAAPPSTATLAQGLRMRGAINTPAARGRGTATALFQTPAHGRRERRGDGTPLQQGSVGTSSAFSALMAGDGVAIMQYSSAGAHGGGPPGYGVDGGTPGALSSRSAATPFRGGYGVGPVTPGDFGAILSTAAPHITTPLDHPRIPSQGLTPGGWRASQDQWKGYQDTINTAYELAEDDEDETEGGGDDDGGDGDAATGRSRTDSGGRSGGRHGGGERGFGSGRHSGRTPGPRRHGGGIDAAQQGKDGSFRTVGGFVPMEDAQRSDVGGVGTPGALRVSTTAAQRGSGALAAAAGAVAGDMGPMEPHAPTTTPAHVSRQGGRHTISPDGIMPDMIKYLYRLTTSPSPGGHSPPPPTGVMGPPYATSGEPFDAPMSRPAVHATSAGMGRQGGSTQLSTSAPTFTPAHAGNLAASYPPRQPRGAVDSAGDRTSFATGSQAMHTQRALTGPLAGAAGAAPFHPAQSYPPARLAQGVAPPAVPGRSQGHAHPQQAQYHAGPPPGYGGAGPMHTPHAQPHPAARSAYQHHAGAPPGYAGEQQGTGGTHHRGHGSGGYPRTYAEHQARMLAASYPGGYTQGRPPAQHPHQQHPQQHRGVAASMAQAASMERGGVRAAASHDAAMAAYMNAQRQAAQGRYQQQPYARGPRGVVDHSRPPQQHAYHGHAPGAHHLQAGGYLGRAASEAPAASQGLDAEFAAAAAQAQHRRANSGDVATTAAAAAASNNQRVGPSGQHRRSASGDFGIGSSAAGTVASSGGSASSVGSTSTSDAAARSSRSDTADSDATAHSHEAEVGGARSRDHHDAGRPKRGVDGSSAVRPSRSPPLLRRVELVETAATRASYKEFYRQLRAKERISFAAAHAFAMAAFDTLPVSVHWRLFLELADLAKRDNRIDEARRLYEGAIALRPSEAQVWLDYSKMEDDVGESARCGAILHEGLKNCHNNEVLLTRAVKHEERLANLDSARELLSRLHTAGLTAEKAWRTLLEGALVEARAGNQATARKLFKYLMTNVSWYGPIYLEAFRFEERTRHDERALRVIRRGIAEIPRYGPLWFGAFRLYEKIETETFLRACVDARVHGRPMFADATGSWLHNTRLCVNDAISHISKELVWKVYFEAAQIEERAAEVASDLVTFPTHNNQLTRAWAGIRGSDAKRRRTGDAGSPGTKSPVSVSDEQRAVAISAACLRRARAAYVHSARHCPSNLRWKVWLAGARTELAVANVAVARALQQQAVADVPAKSRSQVLLEQARLEEYCGNVKVARSVLAAAREQLGHQWKVFLESVLLERRAGNRGAAIEQAEEALALHNGTGRLWAVLMQLRQEDGDMAQLRVFERALQQVPKSGEVWCEGARIAMNLYSQYFDLSAAATYLNFAIQFTPQYGDSFIELLRLELLSEALRVLRRNPYDLMDRTTPRDDDEAVPLAEYLAGLDTSEMEQRCINADPNYGGMWFHCKEHPYDTAFEVIRRAKVLMCLDIAAALTDEEHIPISFGASASFTSFCPDIHGVTMSRHTHRRLLFGSDQIIA